MSNTSKAAPSAAVVIREAIEADAASLHRQGVGRALYARLFEDLAARGFCNAYAGVALPNEASIALHRSVGFEPIGIFRSVGREFGRWHDVAWFQRALRDVPPAE